MKSPHFIDEEFARAHLPFGGRIAPGLMTAVFAAGMSEDILGPNTIAALEIVRMRYPAPVRPGDTLRTRIRIDEKRPSKDPARGILIATPQTFNQHGELVCEFSIVILMRRHAAA